MPPGLRSFMSDNRRKLTAFRPVLERPFQGLADDIAPAVLKALPLHLRPWASVNDDLTRHFRDPRIRLAFTFQSKYLGMSPFRCPSLFTILSFLEYEHGIFHPTRRLRRGVGGDGAHRDAARRRVSGWASRRAHRLRRAAAPPASRSAARHHDADAVVVNARLRPRDAEA